MKKTIKIIDLLNKIANGEEVPEKIKAFNKTFTYLYQSGDMTYFDDDNGDYLFSDNYDWENNLNMEVEIIEEDKKIEISKITKEEFERLDKRTLLELIVKNQNEIIEKLNEMDKGE